MDMAGGDVSQTAPALDGSYPIGGGARAEPALARIDPLQTSGACRSIVAVLSARSEPSAGASTSVIEDAAMAQRLQAAPVVDPPPSAGASAAEL